MDVLRNQIHEWTEGRIDFAGQQDAEKYAMWMLVPAAILAFLVGLIAQDIRLTLAIYGFCFVLALGTLVPAWPMFNKHPVTWKKVEVAPFVAESDEAR